MSKRPDLRPITQPSDPAGLSTDDLVLHNLARDIAEASDVLNSDSLMAQTQRAVRGGDFLGALGTLRRHLVMNALDPKRNIVDRERFAALRDLRKMSQQKLADRIGLRSPSAISHFESRNGYLNLVHLLLAAEALSVTPDQFIRASNVPAHKAK